MNKNIIVLIAVALIAVLSGCQHSTSSSAGTSDSTRIKVIEEMQERGSQYRNSSNFERAIVTHDSCIHLAEEINDTIQLVIALNNQGTNYRRLSANKEAADYHFRALQLCDAYSDTTTFHARKNRVRSLNGLGNVMLSLGNYEAAEKAFRAALAGETRLGSAKGQAINLANIGSIKEYYGELDSARIYYNLSMQKNREDSNAIGISLCYTYLGGLDKKAGHTSEALNNFHKAYAVGQTTGDIWHELTPCLSLAEIYTDAVSCSRFQVPGGIDSASYYISIGIREAAEIHSNEFLRDFYGIRSRLEEKRGNTQQALADLRLCTAYSDSVLTDEERNSVQNARANYESGRRSAEVQAANEVAKTDRVIRNAVIVTAILLIAVLVFAFYLYGRYMQMRNKAEKERAVFVRNIAHQLRTPMTVVAGLVEQLKAHIPTNDSEGCDALETTQRQAEELKNLILQLAKMPKEEIAPHVIAHGDTSPSHGDTSHPSPADSTTLPLREGKGGSILLAEDNNDVAKMICGLLRKHDYKVKWAADGKVALDILQLSDLPDLLITDIAMPNMDGLELMRKVRDDDTMCHLPIIVASARVEDSERMEGINAGAEVYLTKPFIPEELLLRIRTLLEQRERLRRSFERLASDKSVGEPVEPHLTSAEQEFIDCINKTIDESMSSGNLRVNILADTLHMSISTFNRKVKNITGMSSSDYIQARQLEHAKQLLLTRSDLTVSQVSLLCGFSEPTHFNRFFKRHMDITPGEFRKSHAF